jgi:hypothetical protein
LRSRFAARGSIGGADPDREDELKIPLKLPLLLVAVCAVACPSAALADGAASVSVTIPAGARTGTPFAVEVASSFSDAANGAEQLTAFLLPPTAGACPTRAVAPTGADVLLAGEAADQVLIVNALAGRLAVPGSWTACAYLVRGGVVTASASQRFSVSGAALHAAAASHPKAKHHKVKHHKAKAGHTP